MRIFKIFVLSLFLISIFQIVHAQNIHFYPQTDTVKIIDGCTGPEIICTLSSDSTMDSIIIKPGFNTNFEYINAQGNWQFTEKCYFLITDTLDEYDYELIYYPLGPLPYLRPIGFDSAFYTPDYLFKIILIVNSQGAALDSLEQIFIAEYGLGIDDENIEKFTRSIELYPNYPNPFNNNTKITYFLTRRSNIIISVYNTLGQLVEILLREDQIPGEYSIGWHPKNLNSGIYYIHLQSGNYHNIKKCLFLK